MEQLLSGSMFGAGAAIAFFVCTVVFFAILAAAAFVWAIRQADPANAKLTKQAMHAQAEQHRAIMHEIRKGQAHEPSAHS